MIATGIMVPAVFGCAIFSAVILIIISSNLFHCTSYQLTSVRIMEIYRDGEGGGGGGYQVGKTRVRNFFAPPSPLSRPGKHFRANMQEYT